MSFSPTFTVGSNTYLALPTPGSYIDGASSVDEPIYFDLLSTPKPDGNSSFVAKVRRYKNVTGSLDALAQVHIVYKWDTKQFSIADMEALQARVNSFLVTGNITKISRGEL